MDAPSFLAGAIASVVAFGLLSIFITSPLIDRITDERDAALDELRDLRERLRDIASIADEEA